MVLVVRVGHGFEEYLEARQAADILGWATPLTVNETRVFDVRIARSDRLDGNGVPPVIAHVVGVDQLPHAPADEGGEAREGLCLIASNALA